MCKDGCELTDAYLVIMFQCSNVYWVHGWCNPNVSLINDVISYNCWTPSAAQSTRHVWTNKDNNLRDLFRCLEFWRVHPEEKQWVILWQREQKAKWSSRATKRKEVACSSVSRSCCRTNRWLLCLMAVHSVLRESIINFSNVSHNGTNIWRAEATPIGTEDTNVMFSQLLVLEWGFKNQHGCFQIG